MNRALFPAALAVLALAGALVATLYLHREATKAVEQVLHERLMGAGASATALVPHTGWSQGSLTALMSRNALDGAYVLDPGLIVQASASGYSGARVDLLSVDRSRLDRALAGEASAGISYELADVDVGSAYFPIKSPEGTVTGVLVLEAGTAFNNAISTVSRARWVALILSLLAAAGLTLIATQWMRTERKRHAAADRAARAEALTRVAATAAHEIRNPLGIIRGTVELFRERSGATLSPRDRAALEDVLGEVERLRRLTEDLLDLSADRPLAPQRMDLTWVLEEVASSTERSFPGIQVRCELSALPPINGDAGRLRQVFLNLLQNAAQAQGAGQVLLEAKVDGDSLVTRVHDDGPGVPPEVRARLFEPFITTRAQGTGLGLAVSRRLVERHGGGLQLVEAGPGTTFEVRLPTMRE